jgi:predicted ATPase
VFGDGVVLVRLGDLSDPDLVVPTIARTLAVGERAGTPVLETLEAYLRDREFLLVLDGFEHLLSAATAVAGLLAASPSLKVLVTSRSLLRLLGEHEYPVPPLSLPDAVALFVQRAAAVKHDFELSDGNAQAIAEICIRLDGLPLALELAAARCRLLTPEAIVERLEHRLTLLTGGPRDLPTRQQTLRDTIAWSYGLLTGSEQHVFRHLGAFAGGCTVAAVEAVADCDDPRAALDGLSSLLDKSLLLQREGHGEPYFGMLNTIQEYALDELASSGQVEPARTRHAEWYLGLAERAEPELTRAQQAKWLAQIEREHDNLRLALGWTQESDDLDRRMRLAAALARFWAVRGYVTEGRVWLDEALEIDDGLRPEARAKALLGAFVLAHRQGDVPSSKKYADESLRLCKEVDDQSGVARSLMYLGLAAAAAGERDVAHARFTEAAVFAREIGDTWSLAASISNQGDLALNAGDYARARELCSQSLTLQRELGDMRSMAISLHNIAYAYLYEGQYDSALEPLQESLKLAFELGDRDGIAYRLEALAVIAAAEKDMSRAARLLGSAEALFEVIGVGPDPAERRLHESTVVEVQALLGDEAFAAAWAAGRAMSPETVATWSGTKAVRALRQAL